MGTVFCQHWNLYSSWCLVLNTFRSFITQKGRGLLQLFKHTHTHTIPVWLLWMQHVSALVKTLPTNLGWHKDWGAQMENIEPSIQFSFSLHFYQPSNSAVRGPWREFIRLVTMQTHPQKTVWDPSCNLTFRWSLSVCAFHPTCIFIIVFQ